MPLLGNRWAPNASRKPFQYGRRFQWVSKGLFRLALPLAFGAVWFIWYQVGATPHYLLPSPSDVLLRTLPSDLIGSTPADAGNGFSLATHAIASLWRVLLGVVFATLSALPLGMLLGYWPGTGKWGNSLINFGRVLPPAAMVPLAIIWFGIGDPPALFVIWFACFWPILLNTVAGVQGVEKTLRDSALTMGAKPWQLIGSVIVPGASPQIAAGLKIAFGLAWSAVVTAELLAVRNGLGFYIFNARVLFRVDEVFAGILVAGFLGVMLSIVVGGVDRRLFRWQAVVGIDKGR